MCHQLLPPAGELRLRSLLVEGMGKFAQTFFPPSQKFQLLSRKTQWVSSLQLLVFTEHLQWAQHYTSTFHVSTDLIDSLEWISVSFVAASLMPRTMPSRAEELGQHGLQRAALVIDCIIAPVLWMRKSPSNTKVQGIVGSEKDD